ncbi:DUF397 domain-containing protein [Streptomyces sp. SID3343]|uniref:DUF397 domain-containing protein n=1 Tax=Streptomyces sp. SID3343 TaxID=2690260 RepID=UPI00136FCF6F|nr:DUF397 domain-containing protein [Streptomyces sp. SID3343]MYV97563.1 DUF397 domain-containing protein [Streptomyces sp. SID3343]
MEHVRHGGTRGDNCVETAVADQAVRVRDSKGLRRPCFAVGRGGWAGFVRYVARKGP